MLTDEQKESVKDLVKAILAENKPAEATQPAPTEDIEKAKAKKSDDADADDKKGKKEKEDKDADDKDDKKKDMKKSEAETPVAQPADEIGSLSDEEKELVKAWRASKDEPAEEITKAQPAPAQDEELKKALDAQKTENETLKKSLSEQSDLIKALTEKVEKIASQPAYDQKSVTKLEPVEKSQPETEKASKRQVLNALLELQQAGEATSHDVSKYESTNQLSKSLQEKVKNQILKGK